MVTTISVHNGSGSAAGEQPPLVVCLAASLSGHTNPMAHICGEMVKRGFGAVFLAAPEFKAQVEATGAEYFEAPILVSPALAEARSKTPADVTRLLFDFEQVWLPSLVPYHRRLKAVLETVRQREPHRKIVILAEVMSLAVIPFLLGAPLPAGYARLPPVIAVNVIPLCVSSRDTAPFGLGLPPDATESGRLRNAVLTQMVHAPFAHLMPLYMAAMREVGARQTTIDRSIFDAFFDIYDTTFQLCCPSFEYPRSDLAPSIRCIGSLPKRGLAADLAYPAWWPEMTANAALPAGAPERKKVVFVTQGTLAVDYTELLVPTLHALGGRSDLIVVATLGVRGASLGPDVAVPANTHVLDYFPYDAVLAHADVFVTNGGYGGVSHGILNSVPMVVAGLTEDKVEVTAHVHWTGIGLNLRTQKPTSEAIAAAVDDVLGNPRFKARIERVHSENEDLDTLSIIEREIRKYAKTL